MINYDIPWNPTRVIQRVGRINRIGKKVFDELYIFNFFPSEQGADIHHRRPVSPPSGRRGGSGTVYEGP